ncbi:MAG: sigma-70 family RNA polymerase sigma factor, partial [Rhodoglobus sp.]|nr:sigma-70 family RNA polymerase sigma factor [Rhodoglobus sp.]
MPDYPSSTDDQLVEFARAGDAAAYGELFSRHSGIGTAIARRYYQIADADDLVSESFARILSTLQRGGGPRSGFRPYLITTIGNVARRWATQTREGASDELDLIEDPKTVDDPVVASADREFALEAFRSLPDRWQAVLWYSAVEGMGPTDVAGYLGMTPNAAAVLAHRARAGLRTAWVQAHLNDSTLSEECRWTSGRLGKRATGSLSSREQDRVRLHLSSCLACRSRARELDQLSAKLALLLIPALLGIGLTSLEPDDAAMAAAALPASPVSGTLVPAVSTTHLWLAALAVVVATATALATSSALPAVGETRQLAPVSAPVAAPVFSDRGLETKAQPSEPSHG